MRGTDMSHAHIPLNSVNYTEFTVKGYISYCSAKQTGDKNSLEEE